MPTLPGIVQSAPPGALGFDTSTPLSSTAAREFVKQGYSFCLRYVGRITMRTGDLTPGEAQDILGAGLALMVVQHVQSGSGWIPGAALGNAYGVNAAEFTRGAGVPPGVNVWLDLEGVSPGAAPTSVIAYCESWYRRVADAGYLPGIYVGWRARLSGPQLYDLPFQHYWGAFNVDGSSTPACGWCLKQSPGSGGTIAGLDADAYDDDVTRTDRDGRNVQWLAPA